MSSTIKVIEGQALHNEVPFWWQITLYRTPDGWQLMRGSLMCPKEHRSWMYDSGYLLDVLSNVKG